MFAPLLVAQGLNVTFVSRQLGHANPSTTLSVYAHLFDQAEHATKASAQLEAAFGGILDGSEPSDDGEVLNLCSVADHLVAATPKVVVAPNMR